MFSTWYLTRREYLSVANNELKRHLHGVTNTVLTRCLRELEQDDIVIRTSNGSVPPAVTYELTNTGKELIPALDGLYKWGETHKHINSGYCE